MKPMNKVKQFLSDHNYEGILLRQKNNFSWLTEGKRNHIVLQTSLGVADLLVLRDKVVVFTANMEKDRIVDEELSDFPAEVVSVNWYDDLDQVIGNYTKGMSVAADTPFLNFEVVDHKLALIRSVLSESELSRYRTLCFEAAQALESTAMEVQPGQTEYEIAAQLMKKSVSKGMNIDVALVATDERIYKYRHPIATGKKLEKHALLVLCAERGGLVANVTRVVHFGEMDRDLKERAEKVAYIDAVYNQSTKPGVTIGSIVSKGIEAYKETGYPEDWKKLHQGGLTGYSSREFLATPTSTENVQVNQTFTWNPALPGVKSEDTIAVTENGTEFLTYTGDWVYKDIEINGQVFKRPDILIR
ncbi:M24 family metallopeptidase [Halobacillus amylolyticus]|uniref:M24 family metallopeptidase n=1 Tax=Halobacillus amylolyticus TaxID=2932259 RepID=A0ABY4H9N5_9BACI|nr:M24 family metallopeptidase [Halobacillus amylolyticus]UOR11591.1 M24 family metallopeptidase [Halobacillus amylolyticus]